MLLHTWLKASPVFRMQDTDGDPLDYQEIEKVVPGNYRYYGYLCPARQEIVAELGAHALSRLVGKSGGEFLGNSYRYIARYAEKIKFSPHQAWLKTLRGVENALNLILNMERS
jgi:hypothetical protein